MSFYSSEPAVDKIKRHPKYYLNGGDLFFLVENYVYRVHRYFFERESAFFRDRLAAPAAPGQQPKGSSDQNPMLLEDVFAEDFSKFLWVFYNPKYSIYDATQDDWTTILRLAFDWRFGEVRKLCCRELEKFVIPPVRKIEIYQAYELDKKLLIPSYTALCMRQEPLSLKEGRQLGLETVLLLATARECARGTPIDNGARSPVQADLGEDDMVSIIRSVFGLTAGPPSPSLIPRDRGPAVPTFTATPATSPRRNGTTHEPISASATKAAASSFSSISPATARTAVTDVFGISDSNPTSAAPSSTTLLPTPSAPFAPAAVDVPAPPPKADAAAAAGQSGLTSSSPSKFKSRLITAFESQGTSWEPLETQKSPPPPLVPPAPAPPPQSPAKTPQKTPSPWPLPTGTASRTATPTGTAPPSATALPSTAKAAPSQAPAQTPKTSHQPVPSSPLRKELTAPPTPVKETAPPPSAAQTLSKKARKAAAKKAQKQETKSKEAEPPAEEKEGKARRKEDSSADEPLPPAPAEEGKQPGSTAARDDVNDMDNAIAGAGTLDDVTNDGAGATPNDAGAGAADEPQSAAGAEVGPAGTDVQQVKDGEAEPVKDSGDVVEEKAAGSGEGDALGEDASKIADATTERAVAAQESAVSKKPRNRKKLNESTSPALPVDDVAKIDSSVPAQTTETPQGESEQSSQGDVQAPITAKDGLAGTAAIDDSTTRSELGLEEPLPKVDELAQAATTQQILDSSHVSAQDDVPSTQGPPTEHEASAESKAATEDKVPTEGEAAAVTEPPSETAVVPEVVEETPPAPNEAEAAQSKAAATPLSTKDDSKQPPHEDIVKADAADPNASSLPEDKEGDGKTPNETSEPGVSVVAAPESTADAVVSQTVANPSTESASDPPAESAAEAPVVPPPPADAPVSGEAESTPPIPVPVPEQESETTPKEQEAPAAAPEVETAAAPSKDGESATATELTPADESAPAPQPPQDPTSQESSPAPAPAPAATEEVPTVESSPSEPASEGSSSQAQDAATSSPPPEGSETPVDVDPVPDTAGVTTPKQQFAPLSRIPSRSTEAPSDTEENWEDAQTDPGSGETNETKLATSDVEDAFNDPWGDPAPLPESKEAAPHSSWGDLESLLGNNAAATGNTSSWTKEHKRDDTIHAIPLAEALPSQQAPGDGALPPVNPDVASALFATAEEVPAFSPTEPLVPPAEESSKDVGPASGAPPSTVDTVVPTPTEGAPPPPAKAPAAFLIDVAASEKAEVPETSPVFFTDDTIPRRAADTRRSSQSSFHSAWDSADAMEAQADPSTTKRQSKTDDEPPAPSHPAYQDRVEPPMLNLNLPPPPSAEPSDTRSFLQRQRQGRQPPNQGSRGPPGHPYNGGPPINPIRTDTHPREAEKSPRTAGPWNTGSSRPGPSPLRSEGGHASSPSATGILKSSVSSWWNSLG